MSEHPNAVLVHTLANAFASGDLDGLLNCYAEDALFRVAGDNVVSGVYKGHQEIRDHLIWLATEVGAVLRLNVVNVIGVDHYAVMFGLVEGERAGRYLSAKGAMAFKVDDEGRFSESWFLYNDQRAYDEFFS